MPANAGTVVHGVEVYLLSCWVVSTRQPSIALIVIGVSILNPICSSHWPRIGIHENQSEGGQVFPLAYGQRQKARPDPMYFGKATSHLHDTWLNIDPGRSNVGTMPGAWAVSSLAGPGKYLQGWERNATVGNLMNNRLEDRQDD